MRKLHAVTIFISTPILILLFQNCAEVNGFQPRGGNIAHAPQAGGQPAGDVSDEVDDEILDDDDEVVDAVVGTDAPPVPVENPIPIDELAIFYGHNLVLDGIEVGASKTVLLPHVSTDILVDIVGYDVDRNDEVEILAGPQRLGFLPSCESNKVCGVVRVRVPHKMTELTVRQALKPKFRWGFSIVQVSMADEIADNQQKIVDVESIPGHTAASLEFTIVDKYDLELPLPSLVQYRVKGETIWRDRIVQEFSYDFSTQIQVLGGLEDEPPLIPETVYEWRVLVGLERRATKVFSFETLSQDAQIGSSWIQ